jgi:drug/metabolite transporter (DMT)-like permease
MGRVHDCRNGDDLLMRGRPLELLLLGLLALLWGSSFAMISVGIETIPPVTLIGLRCGIAAVALYAVLRLRGLRVPMDGASWRAYLVQAMLATVTPFVLIAWGSQAVSSSLAIILASTSPIFAFLIGLGLRREARPGWLKGLGTLLGILGVVAIAGHQGLGGGSWPHMLALIASGGLFAWSGYTGRGFKDVDPMLPALGAQLCGLAFLIPAALLFERPWAMQPSVDSLLAMLALGLLATALASVIWFRLLRTLGVVATTAQAYLRLPIGTAIGVVFLGETFPMAAVLGLVLVMVGVAMMTWQRPTGGR